MSILAVCARQIEQKDNSKSLSGSLSLYQEAIHLLLPKLQTKNTAVIASCVILCVLEMMSCKFEMSLHESCSLLTYDFRFTKRVEASPRRLCKFVGGSGDQRIRWRGRRGTVLVLRSDGYPNLRLKFGDVLLKQYRCLRSTNLLRRDSHSCRALGLKSRSRLRHQALPQHFKIFRYLR
jgi:hypothetical protein